MRTILLSLLLIFYSSCVSYIDKGNNLKYNGLDFIYLKEYNKFIYTSKVNRSAGKEVFITTNFSIDLPKGISYWDYYGTEFYFKYNDKQMIFINSGYRNKDSFDKWTLEEINEEGFRDVIKSAELQSKYTIKEDRVSKIYSDGRVSILLLNIKEDRIDEFLTLIENFEYLN